MDLTERHQLDHHIITTANNQMAIPWQPNSTTITNTKANHHFKTTTNTSLQQRLVSSYELDLDLLEVAENKP
jgi:hypothetical protein